MTARGPECTTCRRVHPFAAAADGALDGNGCSRDRTDAGITAAYDARAVEYIALLGEVDQLPEQDRVEIGGWSDAVAGRILDAGCGPGLWTRFLHERGRDVLGVDLSAAFIAHARAAHPELTFLRESMRTLPLPDASLGGILAWYSLIHTPPADLPGVLAEFARVLGPGGRVLIGYFDGAAEEPFPHAVTTAYFWSADALTALLDAADFEVTASVTRERAPGEPSSCPHGAITAVRRPSR